MTENEQEHIEDLLRQALPPTSTHSRLELERDLWPGMLRRLENSSAAAVPWFDWALLLALVVGVVLFPGAIPILLYHL